MALVALSLVWMLALAALVVDIGDGWLGRQTLISASDAAALAAAQDLVNQRWDEACVTAEAYVADNAPGATYDDCSIAAIGADGGRVTVTVSQEVESRFIDLGGDNPNVGSTSSAVWGPPATVAALRPFALCYDGSSDLQPLIDDPPSAPTPITVLFPRDEVADCGGAVGVGVGNFATVDFEGGAGFPTIRDWMRDGYPGRIGFDPPTTTGCVSPAVCYERPFASTEIALEIQQLKSEGTPFLFPVYDYADADQVHLIGIVRARLLDYQLSGDLSSQWIEIEVAPGLVAGTCCGSPDFRSGSKVVAICGVDPGAYDTCEDVIG